MKRLAAIVCILAFAGCYNDKADKLYPTVIGGGCDTAEVLFKKDIQPVFVNSCALSGCHDAATPSAGYDFTLHAGAKLAVDNGRLLGAIRHEDGFSKMPKTGNVLDACAISKITRWANLGAKND